MTTSQGATTFTFFFITDTRSTDKSVEPQAPRRSQTSSSHDGPWRYAIVKG